MKNSTKFLIGLGITFLISFLYFLIFYINNINVPFFDILQYPFLENFIILPIVYVFFSIWCKLEGNILKERFSYILKYLFAFFFLLCTFLIKEWNNIETMLPLIVSISILCNWNIKEEKNSVQKKNEETVEKKSNIIFPYLINFITLFIVYVIASMCYYSMESEIKGIWTEIVIMGIAMAFVYWLSYLCYRYLLKNTKTTKIFKIILVLGLLYWIYNYGRSIKEIPFYLLISVDIVAVISLTVQDLILKRNKKQQSFK